MEMSQENSLCSCLKQTKVLSFLIIIYKIREKEGRTDAARGGWYQWEGGGSGERV
jgi:hypothetical protein